MAIGLVGRKCGMTRVFTEAGESVPVTVVEVLPNRVTQVKSVETDGYRAVQVTFGARRPQLLSKAVAGHYAKANVAPGRALIEFRLRNADDADLQTGAELKVDRFTAGQRVDVTGVTIGKGFAGVMKRHNFAGGYASHGHSLSHRAPGSIGQRQTPGRVFPGQAHVRPHGRGAAHDRKPDGRRRRCGAQPAADPRRGAGIRGWPGPGASLGQGGAPGATQEHCAQQGAPAKPAAHDRQTRHRPNRPRPRPSSKQQP